MEEDNFNWKKDPTLKIGEEEIGKARGANVSIKKSDEFRKSSVSEELADLSYEASIQIAKQKDKLIWKAAKQEAEAVVFSNDYEISDMEDGKFTTTENYAICNKIAEVQNYFGEDSYWLEIPAFAHRIAKETESYEEFKREMQLQSPKGKIE